MDKIIEKALRESIKVKEEFIKENARNLILFAEKISQAFTGDRKLMLCGNGGSAADAQHIAAELIGRFKKERKGLPAIALTTDTSILTSVANDYWYDLLFARQVEALGDKGDILIGISTSGNSRNIIRAIEAANFKGLSTIGFLGADGGVLKNLVQIPIIVSSQGSDRVQEVHIMIGHIICSLVESNLF